jgi:hypothetical protein
MSCLIQLHKWKGVFVHHMGTPNCTYQEGERKFHGILQGNGAGPTIWNMMSSPMLDPRRNKRFGTTKPISHQETGNLPAFVFVDDVDLQQERKDDNDIISPQEAVLEWQDSLGSTGGN